MVERPVATLDVHGLSQNFKRASRVSQKMAAVSCCICKQALNSVYAAKKRKRLHQYSAKQPRATLLEIIAKKFQVLYQCIVRSAIFSSMIYYMYSQFNVRIDS